MITGFMTISSVDRHRRPGVAQWIAHWRGTRAQRQRLMELSDHALKDIGLTRADARAEGRRRFWDTPYGPW